MEGFVLIQLHERIVAECAEVDGMYLAHPCADKTNLYIDKDGEGYWVTPKTLATLIGRHTPGMSIEGKHVIPWVPDNLFSSRLESLIHVLEHIPIISVIHIIEPIKITMFGVTKLNPRIGNCAIREFKIRFLAYYPISVFGKCNV